MEDKQGASESRKHIECHITITQSAEKIINIEEVREASFDSHKKGGIELGKIDLSEIIGLPSPDYIPRFVRALSKKEASEQEINLVNALENYSKIVLLGASGVGKTTELKHIAHYLSASKDKVVRWVSLNNYTGGEIQSYISGHNQGTDLSQLILFLDGLDEVQDRGLAIREINRFSDAYPQVKVVLSCRFNFYNIETAPDKRDGTLSGFQAFELERLTYAQTDTYIRQKLDHAADSFFEELRTKQIIELLVIPFYLSLLTGYYSHNHKLPQSKAELFEYILKEKIGHDLKRKEREATPLTSNPQKAIIPLAKIAFVMECLGKNQLNQAELHRIVHSQAERTLLNYFFFESKPKENDTYQFQHNNFQEYLAARVVSRANLKTILSLITFEDNPEKVKLSWQNTIHFLLEMLPKPHSLMEWMSTNSPETLLLAEPDRIDADLRFRVFKKIFKKLADQHQKISSYTYYRYLINFAQNEQALDYLIKNISSQESYRKNNALSILSDYGLSRVPSSLLDTLITKLRDIVFAPDYQGNTALKAYLSLLSHQDRQEIKRVIDVFFFSTDHHQRYLVYDTVHRFDFQDECIDQILEAAQQYLRRKSGDGLTNEITNLKTCLKKVKEEDSLIKALGFISNLSSRRDYWDDVLRTILDRAIELHPGSQKIYEDVKAEILQKLPIFGQSPEKNPYLVYVKKLERGQDLFQAIYNRKKRLGPFSIRILVYLASKEGIEFVLREFEQGNWAEENLSSFQEELTLRNQELQAYLVALASEREVSLPTLPVKVDYEKQQLDKLNRQKELLFDRQKFIAEVERFYDLVGKDRLTDKEFLELELYEQFSEVTTTFLMPDQDGFCDKKRDIDFLVNDQNWQTYSLQKLKELIINRKELILTKTDIAQIKDWCDSQASEINFTTSFKKARVPSSSKWHCRKEDGLFSFFLRKFSWYDYPKALYLDMLSYPELEDVNGVSNKLARIFPFVSDHPDISIDEVKERVLSNLREGIQIPFVLDNHVRFCAEQKVAEAIRHLPDYFSSDWDADFKEPAIQTYLKLEGNPEIVLKQLKQINDEQHWKRVLRELSQYSTPELETYLQDQLNENHTDENKLEIAAYLSLFGKNKVFNRLVDYLENHKKLPGHWDYHPLNLILQLNNTDIIPSLFKFYQLGYHLNLHQNRDGRDFLYIFGTILHNICQSKENYEATQKALQRFIRKLKIKKLFFWVLRRDLSVVKEMIADLKKYAEKIEHNHFTSKKSKLDLKEAIAIYDSIWQQDNL